MVSEWTEVCLECIFFTQDTTLPSQTSMGPNLSLLVSSNSDFAEFKKVMTAGTPVYDCDVSI